jgi:hypothetical protein
MEERWEGIRAVYVSIGRSGYSPTTPTTRKGKRKNVYLAKLHPHNSISCFATARSNSRTNQGIYAIIFPTFHHNKPIFLPPPPPPPLHSTPLHSTTSSPPTRSATQHTPTPKTHHKQPPTQPHRPKAPTHQTRNCSR